LTKWLSSEKEREVRAAIVSALGACGTAAATAPLVTALGDKDAFVRRQAARGLGRLRALDAVGPLTTSLGGDVDADVRREAAAALGSIRSASARPALQKALRDPDPYVTEEAARALTLIGG
jgi:HEAT repeat protein